MRLAPPSGSSGAPRRRPGLRATARARAVAAFRTFVAGADDRRLERTVASSMGLRVLFRMLASAFVADGTVGELAFVVGDARWTVELAGDRAVARAGRPAAPRLTVTLSPADLARIAAGELDPGAALLAGRVDLAGDAGLAMRLGELFSR